MYKENIEGFENDTHIHDRCLFNHLVQQVYAAVCGSVYVNNSHEQITTSLCSHMIKKMLFDNILVPLFFNVL